MNVDFRPSGSLLRDFLMFPVLLAARLVVAAQIAWALTGIRDYRLEFTCRDGRRLELSCRERHTLATFLGNHLADIVRVQVFDDPDDMHPWLDVELA